MCLSQDPVHKWADLQRALLTEGQSVWCCKDCIGIIKEDNNATYEEIRVKVEAAAEPLPEVTGESADPLQKAEAPAEAPAEAAAVAAEAAVKVAEEAAKAAVARAEAVQVAPVAPATLAAPAAPPNVSVTICHCGIL